MSFPDFGEAGPDQGRFNVIRSIGFHPVNDFFEPDARSIRSVGFVADQENPAGFQDFRNLTEAFFQPRPEIDGLKSRGKIKRPGRKRET